jgi:hypothetical protein
MSIELLSTARQGQEAMVIYQGTPNRRVAWSVIGAGTIAPLDDYTDATGKAAAILTPAPLATSLTIEVTAGA